MENQSLNLNLIKDNLKRRGMTKRDIEITEKLLEGKSPRTIANEFFITEKSAKARIYMIQRRLGVCNIRGIRYVLERIENESH